MSGHGTEGRPFDPLPLAERYGQFSRHACNQHSHQVPLCEKPREVFTGGGEGEEEDVPGGMPSSAQAILPLFCLGGWVSWSGGNSNPEKVSQSLGHRLSVTLLKDVWVHQK